MGFKCSEIKEVIIGNKTYTIKTEQDEKKLKGYQFDSLVYRYIRAREQMAEYEFYKNSSRDHDKKYYYKQAERDIMRFIQILEEVIGEHE